MAVRRRDRGPTDEAARLAHMWGDLAKGVISPDPLGPLHWLRSWSVRLLAFVEKDVPADRLDGLAYRPCASARRALGELSVRHPQPVGLMRESLAFTEERYAEFIALLPPEGCPVCGSADDFEDIDPRQIDPLFRREVVGLSDIEMRTDEWRVRRCFECGKATKIRTPSPAEARLIEQAGWNAGAAVASLARDVAVAVKAIDEAERIASDSDGHPKNPAKKSRRAWDGKAVDCAKAYKRLIDDGDCDSLRNFCLEFAGETGGESLYKKLNEYRSEWDPDGRYKNVRAPRPRRSRKRSRDT